MMTAIRAALPLAILLWTGVAAFGGDPAFPPVEELPGQEGFPDPFLMADGRRVADEADWAVQREHLKALLAHYLYGRMPPKPASATDGRGGDGEEGATVRFEFGEAEPSSFDGVPGETVPFTIRLSRSGRSLSLRCALVKPEGEGPFPVIVKNDRFTFAPGGGVVGEGREALRAGFLETMGEVVPEALRRGYALCQYIRTDLAPDEADNRDRGVFPLYPEAEYDWGTIAAWAWGYQLVIDALETQPWADLKRIVATGHSRGGKAALCGGIYEERIAVTAPNSSGTGGTGSLVHFEEGQRPQTIAVHRDHPEHRSWWHPRFLEFAEREERLPFDSHTLMALVAPRALVNPHALQDYWANPYGTELAHRAARSVYEWLGAGDRIALHWRPGGHAQGVEDWRALLDFADHRFRGEPLPEGFRIVAYPGAELPVGWEAPERP